MKDTDYTSLTGYLRVLEKRLLNREGVERLIDAPNAEEAVKLISQTSQFDLSGIEAPEMYEAAVKAELKRAFAELYAKAPETATISIALAKYDYHNVKTAVKAKYLSGDPEYLYFDYTPVSSKLIRAAAAGEKAETLPEHLAEAVRLGISVYEQTRDPQVLDIAVDKHMLGYIGGLAGKSEFLREYARFSVDFYNLKTLMRAKAIGKSARFLKGALAEADGALPASVFAENFDQPYDVIASKMYYKYFGQALKHAVEDYEKNGNFSALEKSLDNYLIEHLKKSKYVAFGPEVLLSYILCKESEARQIRVIMTCKLNGISADILRERLRDNYA
ncbi:MAG: V-type ATP synthase subunit C [Clostridiales bacterium]|jgi:V/A-type H+-transporting ATPase subunit C|nr:V-type ATP synthase subunit C [Clostridiales bacterium]